MGIFLIQATVICMAKNQLTGSTVMLSLGKRMKECPDKDKVSCLDRWFQL